jgi:hypothetical protein
MAKASFDGMNPGMAADRGPGLRSGTGLRNRSGTRARPTEPIFDFMVRSHRLSSASVLFLGLAGATTHASLSGAVRLPSGAGISGVTVALSSTALPESVTDSAGRWSMGASAIRRMDLPDRMRSASIVFRDGRLEVDFRGAGPNGRMMSENVEAGIRAAARRAAVLDTLVFTLKGIRRAVLPIGTLDSGGIVTVIDTTTACAATVPSGTAYYASPTGTGTTCSFATPCALGTAAKKPKAGETVYLRGGSYSVQYFNIGVSGSPDSGWITFAAYPCELPILEAGGLGVSGSYVRIDGIVSRNAASGMGNKWTGAGTTNSNGHVEFLHCIADGNTRNGIAFNSAVGVHIKQCIVAHNGASTTASWSSGVNIYGAQGTYQDNIVESTVAFENVDNQHHSDGSGFIVDDIGTGTTFVNNIGFRNGGSCIRLTTSTNTHILNNTCYHDGLDSLAGSDSQYTQPKSPGEILFSSAETRTGAVLLNNLAAASGWNGTQGAYANAGTVAIAPWNLAVDKNGATPFFNDPGGDHPDFHLTSTSTVAIGKGTSTQAPATDIGFDPACIAKAPPSAAAAPSWWIYSVDYDHIRMIGGVARCFQPKARTGAVDLGAYSH